MQFIKGNRKHKKHKPTQLESQIFAAQTMLDHMERGIDLPVSFYDDLARKNRTGKWDAE